MGTVRIGTCSWTDKTMLKAWYPSGVSTPEGRLRYYAARFDTVEADSTFYAIPDRSTPEKWADRTPEGFVFHVKAYGLMTRHDVDARMMHPALHDYDHELTARGRVRRPHADMVDAAFDLFLDAIDPLKDAGKLGGVLLQFPPWFTAKDAGHERTNLGYLEYAREKLHGYRVLVEFRHPSWVTGPRLARTMRFLRDRGMAYVPVDAPQFETGGTMPPVCETTSDWAYVRFHGRNASTYYKRADSAADRFDYLYTPEELREWDGRVREIASAADETFVMFNNCKYDYAPTNAREMAEILADVVERHDGVLPGEPAAPEDLGEGRLF